MILKLRPYKSIDFLRANLKVCMSWPLRWLKQIQIAKDWVPAGLYLWLLLNETSFKKTACSVAWNQSVLLSESQFNSM